MSDQYLRACSLTIGGPDGNALDLSDLHIRFQVNNGDVETPNHAQIRVYNVAADTAKRVQKEFTQVVLQAGYQGRAGVIFAGQVKQIRRGRENGTDTFLDILAADGDVAYNFATINHTLAAGHKPEEMRRVLLKAMEPFGVTEGVLAPLPDVRAPRGRVMAGPVKQYMRELCETYGMSWSIVLGQLNMVPVDGVIGPDEVFEINAATGMVGLPEQTLDGIMVKCLLNPLLKPSRQILLNNDSIQELSVGPQYGYVDVRPSKDADGRYKIWAVNHSGDTRGNVWHTDLVCTAFKGNAPLSQTFIRQGIYGP